MVLDGFFSAKTVAVIGASRDESKIGSVIFQNLLKRYKGKAFPVNPNADEILGQKCFPSVLKIPERIDLAVICTPAKTVPAIINECGKARIKNVVIISSGFKEVGDTKLENELIKALEKNKIKCIGPNCLGIFDSESGLDTLFLPEQRLKRPFSGGISFVSQSGALGSALLDLAGKEGYGFAKFISYGNAANIDESDILDYLSTDPDTRVICLYIEGVANGRKFLETSKRTAAKKPVIVIKGGLTEAGSRAALSHTGSLAGTAEVYLGAFRQAGLVIAETLEEMFEFAKIFEKTKTKPKGKRVQIVTNGGGYGIVSADAIAKNNLEPAQPEQKTKKALKSALPPIATIGNPLDLLGDATTERYKLALEQCIADTGNDILLVVVLPQTPLINVGEIAELLGKLPAKKPVIAVATGSEYAELLKRGVESRGIPCFDYPETAVKAIKKFTDYWLG